ncbi:MAG: DUF456 domain-containing protein [Prevotellaceae bacterium]|jgi:uncharacterized protein YqgC (DUF456 family)|nr:DUF456 domain-containing protein [Prevotellaceae bacterium]
MTITLIILSIVCLLVGLLGCIVPVLPGPPLGWAGLLLLKFTPHYENSVSWTWIVIWAFVAIVVTIMDYYIPVWGTKKMGGSKAGVWGATLGMVFGLFFLPIGIIIFPFVGALIGELLAGKSSSASLKAAVGSFLGFLLSTGLKIFVCGAMAAHFAVAIFSHH